MDYLFDVRDVSKEGKQYTIRGLKWCNNVICSNAAMKSRDEIGTINIFIKSRDDYPDCYDRPTLNEDGSVQRGVKWDTGPQKHVLGKKKN